MKVVSFHKNDIWPVSVQILYDEGVRAIGDFSSPKFLYPPPVGPIKAKYQSGWEILKKYQEFKALP